MIVQGHGVKAVQMMDYVVGLISSMRRPELAILGVWDMITIECGSRIQEIIPVKMICLHNIWCREIILKDNLAGYTLMLLARKDGE